jgi:hypothetical protein
MTDKELTQAMAELQDVVSCRCDEALKDRGLQDTKCQCESAEAVKVVASRIKDLEAKLAKAEEALICGRYFLNGEASRAQFDRVSLAALATIKGESHA